MPSPAIPTFGCIKRAGSEEWLVVFNDRTSFHAIASKADLTQLCMACPTVLLLGVFDWSNYSRDVFRDMATDELWFSQHSIGVGVMSLENSEQLRTVSPDVFEHSLKVNTEPVLFCFVNGVLNGVIAGPRLLADIKQWTLQQAYGLSASSKVQQADDPSRNMPGDSSPA